jgi:hypothetical protein
MYGAWGRKSWYEVTNVSIGKGCNSQRGNASGLGFLVVVAGVVFMDTFSL